MQISTKWEQILGPDLSTDLEDWLNERGIPYVPIVLRFLVRELLAGRIEVSLDLSDPQCLQDEVRQRAWVASEKLIKSIHQKKGADHRRKHRDALDIANKTFDDGRDTNYYDEGFSS